MAVKGGGVLMTDNARIKRGMVSRYQKPRVRLYCNGSAMITQGNRHWFVLANPSSVQQALTAWDSQ